MLNDLDWQTIKSLAQQAGEPLADEWLESVNAYHEPYRRFLYLLIKELQADVVLELGIDQGYTTAHMTAAVHENDGLCIGVDIQAASGVAASLNGRYGCYQHVHCDSLGAAEVVAQILGERRLGVVFQDSSHHSEPSRLEWEYYKPLLEDGFVWVCDDITPAFRQPDEPRSMVDYFDALPGGKMKFKDMHWGNMIGVVREC